MKITYSIPMQTVSLEISPEEIGELKEDAKKRIKVMFMELVDDLRSWVDVLKGKAEVRT